MFREPNRIGDPDFVKKGPCWTVMKINMQMRRIGDQELCKKKAHVRYKKKSIVEKKKWSGH